MSIKDEDLDALIESIEKDLPHIKVELAEDAGKVEMLSEVKDKITGKIYSQSVDNFLFRDESYIKHWWEKVRRDILIERGLKYGEIYKSPSSLSSMTDYISYTPWTVSPHMTSLTSDSISATPLPRGSKVEAMSIDEILGTPKPKKPKAVKPPKEKKDYKSVQDFGIF